MPPLEKLVKALFTVYIILLVWTIIFKCGMIDYLMDFYVESASKFTFSYRFYRSIIPFMKIYLTDSGPIIRRSVATTDILNVCAFIPFGFLAYYLNGKNAKRTLRYALLTTCLFEAVQFFTLLGAFATKDVITNFCGAIIGILLFRVCTAMKLGQVRSSFVIALICLSTVAIFVAAYTIIINFDGYLFILLRS